MAYGTKKNESTYKKEALDTITKQIHNLIGDVVTGKQQEELRKKLPEVDANPFAVWVLKTDDLGSAVKDGKDLSKLATDTNRWHHQIKFSGGSLAYARSAPSDNEMTHASLSKLSVSSLAKHIDEAVKWVDKNVRNKPSVRLLAVPAYHVNALWWIDEAGDSQVRVLPGRFTKEAQTFDSQGFLTFLEGKPRVFGIKTKV